MDINEKVQEWLEKARENFFALDLKALDETLSPEEHMEWDKIYASFRSGSLMRGRIIGMEHMPHPGTSELFLETAENKGADMPCMIVLPYRVKILIPEPFFGGRARSVRALC